MTEQEAEAMLQPCPECGGRAFISTPCYADEGGTMAVCEDCDHTSESFVLGVHSEGIDLAVRDWNAQKPKSDPVVEKLLTILLSHLNIDQYRLELDRKHFKWVMGVLADPHSRVTVDNIEEKFHALALGVPYRLDWDKIRAEAVG